MSAPSFLLDVDVDVVGAEEFGGVLGERWLCPLLDEFSVFGEEVIGDFVVVPLGSLDSISSFDSSVEPFFFVVVKFVARFQRSMVRMIVKQNSQKVIKVC